MGVMKKCILECSFFSVLRPDSANVAGLFECLQKSFQQFGISMINAENCKRLISIGTDSALKHTAFDFIDDMLTRLYYIHYASKQS